MRPTARAILTCLVAIGGALAAGPTPARAQMGGMAGGGRSLGGYGAGTITSYYSGGGGGYLPYNGNASGFVPLQGGAGGGMDVQTPRRLNETPIGGVMMGGTPIGGGSLAAETMRRAFRGGGGMDSGMGSRTYAPFGNRGAMAGAGGGMLPATGRNGARRKPSGLGFGYPFRMPPGLTSGTAGGMGMP